MQTAIVPLAVTVFYAHMHFDCLYVISQRKPVQGYRNTVPIPDSSKTKSIKSSKVSKTSQGLSGT